jgi:hypothetical protein
MNSACIRTFAVTCVLAVAGLFPVPVSAASTFYGIVRHVSINSIKVDDPRTNQTLSFELLPKFDKIFSGDGKTTYQMLRRYYLRSEAARHPSCRRNLSFDQPQRSHPPLVSTLSCDR